MKIMIDISEKTYNEIMDDAKNTPRNLNYYERIIADGNPIDFGNVSSRQAVLDALCDECELFHKNGEQTCLTKCESYHFLATLLSVSRSENPTRCEDAVSRQAVLMELDKYLCGVPFDEKGIDEVIKELPSVSVAEETGHWSRKTKVDAYDLCGVKTWGIKCQCDRCTFTTTVVEDFGYYKYCPNCGAKMEVEE